MRYEVTDLAAATDSPLGLSGAPMLVSAFAEARWNVAESRVEMHLVSRVRQGVTLGLHRFEFLPDESIHTENSYKYGIEAFSRLALAAGYAGVMAWTDPASLFSIHLLEVL